VFPKNQLVSQIAPMVANILLFWGSEQKILPPAGNAFTEKAQAIRFKKN